MQRAHLTYLLRLWQADSAKGLVWRASLENPHTGERHGFGDLDALLTFLEGLGGGSTAPQGTPGDTGSPAGEADAEGGW